MPRKKFTYNQVKEFIENEGYTLLSDKYVGALSKLQVKCPKDHEYWVTYASFKSGRGCPHCSSKAKFTYEQVKEFIENEGYKLISDEYVDAHKKLEVECPKWHKYEVNFNSFKNGTRCSICAGNKKHTYGYVKNFIESKGYFLISKEYKGTNHKLKIRCDKGHIYEASFKSFKRGNRCKRCDAIKRNKSYKHKFEYVNEIIKREGYILISEEYKGTNHKLKIRCDKGHIYEASFKSFKSGKRCQKCYFNSRKLLNKEILESLKLYENIRENDNKEIEMPCTYCGKYHIPKRNHLLNRIRYIEGISESESLIYCSDNCKKECPIFRKQKYPKGHKPETSREVQPQLRKLIFERDNYTCQKCDTHKDDLETGLHCHHIDAVINNPIESADMDNCITLCKNCHKEVHKIPGCGYHELRCTKEERIS